MSANGDAGKFQMLDELLALDWPHAYVRVLVAVLQFADADGSNIFPTMDALARRAGVTERTARDVIAVALDRDLLLHMKDADGNDVRCGWHNRVRKMQFAAPLRASAFPSIRSSNAESRSGFNGSLNAESRSGLKPESGKLGPSNPESCALESGKLGHLNPESCAHLTTKEVDQTKDQIKDQTTPASPTGDVAPNSGPESFNLSGEPPPKPAAKKRPAGKTESGFDDFWQQWPRHPNKNRKQAAAKYWRALKPEDRVKVMPALEAWKSSEKWRAGYVHNPANWLRDRLFDEPPEPAGAAGGNGAGPGSTGWNDDPMDANNLMAANASYSPGWPRDRKLQYARDELTSVTRQDHWDRIAKTAPGAVPTFDAVADDCIRRSDKAGRWQGPTEDQKGRLDAALGKAHAERAAAIEVRTRELIAKALRKIKADRAQVEGQHPNTWRDIQYQALRSAQNGWADFDACDIGRWWDDLHPHEPRPD